MMEDNLFDQIARSLASPIPRRQALRRILGGLAGAALATVGLPGRAQAAGDCKKDSDCGSGSFCCNKKVCCTTGQLCCGSGASSICCPSGGSCCGNGGNVICCSANQVCTAHGNDYTCTNISPH